MDSRPSRDAVPPQLSAEQRNRAQLSSLAARAFHIVNKPENAWAREFLFNNSPSATTQMLTDPSALAHAVTARLSISAFEDEMRTDTTSDGLFDSSRDVDFLYVPSFSSGMLTVGVAVNRVKRSIYSDSKEHPTQALQLPFQTSAVSTSYGVGRFVLDTGSSGEMLMLKHSDEYSVAHWFYNESTTKRRGTRLMLDRQLFQQGRLVDSIRQSFVISESCFCRMCKASPAVRCCCIYPPFIPRHPFDFSGFCVAMYGHVGEYVGSEDATAVIPSSNAAAPLYVRSPLISRIDICGYRAGDREPGDVAMHNSISSLLINFATQLSISEADPTRLVMPTTPGERPHGSLSSPTNFGIDSNASNESALYFSEAFDVPALNTVLPLSDSCDPGVISSGSGLVGTVTPVPLAAQAELSTMVCYYSSSDAGGDVLSFSHDVGLPFYDAGRGPIITGNAVTTTDCLTAGVSLGDSTTSSCCNGGALSEEGGRGIVQGVALPKKYARVVDESARIARDDRRRAKNREAAARSNARRKELNDYLKREVKTSRDQIAHLQARQARLREENHALRHRLDQLS
jgi:Basic region leucine zipper